MSYVDDTRRLIWPRTTPAPRPPQPPSGDADPTPAHEPHPAHADPSAGEWAARVRARIHSETRPQDHHTHYSQDLDAAAWTDTEADTAAQLADLTNQVGPAEAARIMFGDTR